MLFELLKARRGRKAAVALIGPLVEQSRRHAGPEIPESVWFSPYMVGFMGMLISLVAERAAGSLSSDAIGTIQVEAWHDITGCKSHAIGEEICLLSTAGHRDFVQGCDSARRFLEALENSAGQPQPNAAPPGYKRHAIEYDPATAAALWTEYVDSHLGAPAGYPGQARF